MQRILTTTTILALSAGFALAEVTVSGDARMGIISDFGDAETAFTSRSRVSFTLSGESDSGLAFGASFRADNAGDAASGTAGSVYVSMSGLKLSMGDVDGAAQAAVGQVDGVGLTGLGDLNEIKYVGAGGTNNLLQDAAAHFSYFSSQINGDPTALLEYTAGSLSLYASVTQPSHTYSEPCCFWPEADTLAFGAAYALDGYKLSIGYERWDGRSTEPMVGEVSIDNLVLGADATFGAVSLKARYSEGGSQFQGFDQQNHQQIAVSATYTADALSVTAFASDIAIVYAAKPITFYDREAYGLGVAYDLGGGAKIVGGYAHKIEKEFSQPRISDDAFDLGLSFSF